MMMMVMVVVVHLSLIKVISNAAKTDKSVQKVLSDGSDSPDFSWTFEIQRFKSRAEIL